MKKGKIFSKEELTFRRKLGYNIAQKRISKNLTQEQLAELVGTDTATSTISRWENGSNTPSAYNLAVLTKIFGCSLDDLIPTVNTIIS